MGKRKREASMEKHGALKQKFKELEQHKYWDYSKNSHVLDLISGSPRKLMSWLQDEEGESLSSNACSVCSDCLEDEEVRSVVASSASVRDDMSNDDKFYDEEKEEEIRKGSGEIIRSTGTDVKNAEKIRSVGWEFRVLISVLVLIGLVIAVMLSVRSTWYVDQDLSQVFLVPT